MLQASLDKTLGGGIVENLDALYCSMTHRQAGVALEQRSSSLDKVLTLLVQIKAAGGAISPEYEAVSARYLAANSPQARRCGADT